MSTKIYEAYRVPVSKLNDFIAHSHKHMIKNVVKVVKGLMSQIPQPEVPIPDHIRPERHGEYLRYKAFEQIMEKAYKASLEPLRDIHDIDCGLNIWIHGLYAYIIPIGCEKYDFIKKQRLKFKVPDYAEDYSYYNNTDHPTNISYRSWEARGRMWDKICTGEGLASHNALRLYHSIIDMKTGRYTEAMEIEEILFPDRWK